ncbi:MAG TPA: DUF2007 domain-containing protein [Longimicrobiales bacterium]|nr:DUF2007 domain-containing protein [Longimicrobiales bacterium]
MDRTGDLKRGPSVGGAPHWTRVAVFAAEPEAELARQQLEGADIPVAVLNDRTGIFGPGFAGPTPLGITVLVPEECLEEARELIADLIEAFGGEAPADG